MGFLCAKGVPVVPTMSWRNRDESMEDVPVCEKLIREGNTMALFSAGKMVDYIAAPK